jgi:tetratricopeptide (TPR) repeat protein
VRNERLRATIRTMDWQRRGVLDLVRVLAPSALPRLWGWSAVVLIAAGAAWTSPVSPVALWRADVMLGQGRPFAAAGIYDAVSRSNPMPGLRAQALERSALTWAVELGLPGEAARRLETRLQQPMSASDRADLLERLGALLVDAGRPADAAVRLREAHDLDPSAPAAGLRLTRSARAALQAGDLALADATWRRLGRLHPELLARAELGRANIALHKNQPEDALALYESAVDHAFDPDVVAVARLGAATCLERLGDLEQALAELDEAELPPDVYSSRSEQLRARDSIR